MPCENGGRRAEEDRPLASGRAAAKAAACAAAAFLAVGCAALVIQAWPLLSDAESVRAWIASQGAAAPLAMACAVVAQIVVAVLPGEPIELAAGYLFGFWGGTALCLAGSLAGTLAVIALVRLLGMKAVLLFFSREQLDGVPWIRDSARLEAVMFAVFLVPGTPKDVLTYAAALTGCPWWRIALIATVGRIPSVASSTLAAGFAAEGDWLLAAVTAAATAALAIAGGAAYAAARRRNGGA